MKNSKEKIALGSANFGLRYGISNTGGVVQKNNVKKILEYAKRNGIQTIDTAVNYGESERILGDLSDNRFSIVTKIGRLNGPNFGEELSIAVKKSQNKLGANYLYGVLLHDATQLLEPNGKQIAKALMNLKEVGLIEKIGISIYGPEILEPVTALIWPDIVQAPFNVLDQRFYTSGWAERFEGSGTEIHTRSCFLQGLLLMKDVEKKPNFKKWAHIFESWKKFQIKAEMTSVELALGFCLAQNWITRIIVGVESVSQLIELKNVKPLNVSLPPDLIGGSNETNLINPYNWR